MQEVFTVLTRAVEGPQIIAIAGRTVAKAH